MVTVINRKKAVGIAIIDFFVAILYWIYYLLTLRFILRKKGKSINNILIVNSGYLGDSILNIPMIKAIRAKYKDSKITMLVNPKFLDLWNNFKEVDQILTYDFPWIRYGYKIKLSDIKNYLKFIKKLKNLNFDMVIDSRGDIRNNFLILHASKAWKRVGFGITGGSYFLTDVVKWGYQHEVDNSLEIAKYLGCNIKENIPKLDVSKKDMTYINQLLKKNKITGKKIVIAPGAGYPTKEWPLENWTKLINELTKKYKIILAGSPKDTKYEKLPNDINLIGKLKLTQSAALMKSSNLLISPDSGSAHLAAAVGTKTITLIGPTDPIRWRPYGPKNKHILVKSKVKCSPCGLLFRCKYNIKCMKEIKVEDVLKEV